MKTFILIFAFLFLTINTSFANTEHDGGHSVESCTTDQPKVCAHLGFLTKLNSTDAAEFYTHVITPENTEIKNLKVDIWMSMGSGHGHGSAPVIITPVSLNKYKVTEAYFIMMGEWLVRLDFELQGKAIHLEIPVQINQ